MDKATDERAPILTKINSFKQSEARSTGVQLKSDAKLSTVIGLTTKHADCRMAFKLKSIRE